MSADAGPTRLLLLRHGEVAAEERGTFYGQRDVALSPHGVEQSRRTGLFLRRHPVRAVYSSDLQRARLLAEEVGRHRGLRPALTASLRERHFGAWQGLPWEEIQRRYPEETDRYHQHRFTFRAPEGAESFQDVQHRVLAFQREAVQRHAGQVIAFAAHSGPLRILLAEALGMPLEAIFRFSLDYCSLSIIDLVPETPPRVLLLNATDHLRDAE